MRVLCKCGHSSGEHYGGNGKKNEKRNCSMFSCDCTQYESATEQGVSCPRWTRKCSKHTRKGAYDCEWCRAHILGLPPLVNLSSFR